MAHRTELSPENKGAVDQALDYPKLQLKSNEVARLAIFAVGEKDGKKIMTLPKPESGYFFGVQRVDGSFGGSFECLAPDEVVRKDEFDSEACPHCAAVMDGAPEDLIQPRRRRHVMHVIRYRTAPGKSTLISPFSVECIAWTFTDRYLNALIDAQEEWKESGGLLGHDILLKCTNQNFQTFDISILPEAAYRKDRELLKLVFGTYQNGVELAPTLGRKLGAHITKEQMQAKINEVLRAADMSGDVSVSQVDPDTIADLADDLFGETGAIPDSAVAEAAVASEDLGVEVEEPAAKAGEGEPAADEVEEIDFDAFFES